MSQRPCDVNGRSSSARHVGQSPTYVAHRIARHISLLAIRSLYHELALYPKPGLVSLRDNGAHCDMNAATFVRSLFSLRGYFFAIAEAGMREAGFAELQQLGIDAESHMLRATRGINTHRGAIFTHGILAAAAGCAAARNITPTDENLRAIVTDNWSRDLRAIAVASAATPSHGQLMAARHGVTGARGEALQAFPSVFGIALPALRYALACGAEKDIALLHTFFVLLAGTTDTNVLFRGGAEGLVFIQAQAKDFLERGSVFEAGWQQRAESLHRQCSARNLSPGGCADLLAAAWFVHQLQTIDDYVIEDSVLAFCRSGSARHGGQALHSHSAKSPKNGDISRWLSPPYGESLNRHELCKAQ